MTNKSPIRTTARIAGLLLSLLPGVHPLAAQDARDPPDDRSGLRGLRPELTVERTLFGPGQPIRVRFTLVNPTSQPVEIPLSNRARPDAVGLPQELILGYDDQPSLLLGRDADKPAAVKPVEAAAPRDGDNALRLAAFAAIGAELDLRGFSRRLRYSGAFLLEWRPLGGRIAPATILFRVETPKLAVLSTDFGKITFELMYDPAPANVENLLELIRDRFYDGLTMHRVIPDFIIQGGSPDGTPNGIRPDQKLVVAEFHDAPFEPGTLAMARRPTDANTASCQFFIALNRLEELDGQYTVVGQARDPESIRTLQQIAKLPTDANDRPLRPVVIRFFTLIDAPARTSRKLELRRP